MFKMKLKKENAKKGRGQTGVRRRKNFHKKNEKFQSSQKNHGLKTKLAEFQLSKETSGKKMAIKREPSDQSDEPPTKKSKTFQKSWQQKKLKLVGRPDSKLHRGDKRKPVSGDRSSAVEKKENLLQMKKKQRKKFRQKSENKIFDLTVQLKQIWEEVRRDDCSTQKRSKLLEELLTLMKGHVYELIFAHDTVRVVECLVALGTAEHRNALFDELKEHVIPLSKSKYAKFFVLKILKYGTKTQKDYIINSFHGKIKHLLRHSQAAAIVECAYNEYAGALQRSKMVQEFYGPSFTHFKDENIQSLSKVLEKDPTQNEAIISHMKEILHKIIDKPVLQHSIIHHVLREFMTHTDAQSRAEMIESLRNKVAEILHTKDGARVAMNCVWHGTAKDRKAIVKSFKLHVLKIAKEEFGHLVLLAVFDSVDDVKLVERIVLSQLMSHTLELAQDQYGRRVLSYLLCPRDGHFFHPDVVNILRQGDGNVHSKKTPEVRHEELLGIVSKPLLKLGEDNCETLLADNATCLLLTSIIQHAAGDKTGAFTVLSNLAAQPYTTESENMHIIECPGSHFMLKKLVLHDSKTKDSSAVCFSKVLTKTVPHGIMKTWTECNRGAFLLVSLLETDIPSVVAAIQKEMKGFHKDLACKNSKGAQLLLNKLKQL